MRKLFIMWVGAVVISSTAKGVVKAATPAPAPASEATISSDELEIQDNGEQAFFRGHVILKQDPYLLHADSMKRAKKTGIVEASGHLDGTWLSGSGERVKAYGRKGRYTPSPQVTELWEKAELVRWETERDTAPVHIYSDHFTAYHKEREFYGKGHVVINQEPKISAKSEEANYDQNAQTIHLYGPERVFVRIVDGKGSGDFTGDDAWVTMAPKTAKMVGHVQGHVIPNNAL